MDKNNTKLPLIGLTPLIDQNMNNSLWMLTEYMHCIADAGGVPVILSYYNSSQMLDVIINKCDGIIFTGGQDVSPEIYFENPSSKLKKTCSIRDEFEVPLLKKALDANLPILGICRGLQLINAVLGGKLYQDIPSQLPTHITHSQQKPYDAYIHNVKLIQDSPLNKLLGQNEIFVNSLHHQGVKKLANCLKPMAVSEDGLIEAFYSIEHNFLWAVQWHPEYLYKVDKNARRIFEAFIENTK